MNSIVKSFLKVVVLGLFATVPAGAFTYKCNGQEAPSNWWSAGISGMPFPYTLPYSNHTTGYADGYPVIKNIYTNYRGPMYTTGNISGQYGWNLFRAFSVAASAAFTPYWTCYYDGYTKEKIRNGFSCTLWVVGEARLMYVNRPRIRFFSSLDLGIGVGIKTGRDGASDMSMVLQLNPIGLEFGDRWFGSLKFGVGVEYMGAQIGFGHRF